jgi:hypothetical protein
MKADTYLQLCSLGDPVLYTWSLNDRIARGLHGEIEDRFVEQHLVVKHHKILNTYKGDNEFQQEFRTVLEE